jgi:phosphatidylserine synthase
MLPAMLLLVSVGRDEAWRAPIAVAAGIYVAGTMLRLARQAQLELLTDGVGDPHGARGVFAGMPAPVAGNCLLAVVVLAPPAPVVVATAVLAAALMVADFPYPNNHSLGAWFVGGLLAASFAAIAGLISLDVPAAVALIGLLPLAFVRVYLQRRRRA